MHCVHFLLFFEKSIFFHFFIFLHATQKMHAKIFLRAVKYLKSNIFRPHEKILKTRFSKLFWSWCASEKISKIAQNHQKKCKNARSLRKMWHLPHKSFFWLREASFWYFFMRAKYVGDKIIYCTQKIFRVHFFICVH